MKPTPMPVLVLGYMLGLWDPQFRETFGTKHKKDVGSAKPLEKGVSPKNVKTSL